MRRGYEVFPSHPTADERPGPLERLRQIVAALVHDSAMEAMPAGVRSGAPVPRQLLFETESADLDLKLLPGECGRTVSLYGQVAPRSPAIEVASLQVRLVPESAPNRSTSTNAFGEFVFEDLAPGAFAVAIIFEGAVVTLGPVDPAGAD